MRQGYEIKRIKEICKKGSSNVAQKDLKDCDGEYPIYGASGFIKKVNFFHQEEECIGLVKDGAGVGRVLFLPPQSSVIGTLQYIKPNEGYDIRYIGYCLQSINLSKYSQGATIPHIYFKDYGEEQVVVATDTLEQQRIVDILDAEFTKIDALKENAERNLQNAKDLFQAVLRKELEPKEGWDKKSIDEVVSDIFSGGDAPKDNMSKEPTEKYCVPIYANAVENDGLYGYTDYSRVHQPSITVSARGSGTGHTLRRYDSYLPIVRLIVIIPNSDIVLLDYIYYSLRSVKIDISGSAIPQLTVPMLKKHEVNYPVSLKEQQRIVSVLDDLSVKCCEIENNYKRSILLCNDLKQALLRKAFNGELLKYLP